MTSPNSDHPTAPPYPPSFNAVPPQQPGSIGKPEPQAVWPTILGVISIVLGVGACLGGVWGVFAPQFFSMIASTVPAGQSEELEQVKEITTWIAINSVFTIAIGLILLFAGIYLIKRQRLGIKLCRVWAVIKMIFVVYGTYMGVIIQQEQFRQMQPQGFPVGNLQSTMMVVGFVFGIGWGWAYPLFLLVWLARGKSRREYETWP